MKVTIWCYDCGAKWKEAEPLALYRQLSRCPLTIGNTACNGYTDGVEVKS